MHLREVFIFSSLTAQEAMDTVNSMIRQYDDENTTVNFDLKIESSVAAGRFAETIYTLVIYIFSMVYGEEYANGN